MYVTVAPVPEPALVDSITVTRPAAGRGRPTRIRGSSIAELQARSGPALVIAAHALRRRAESEQLERVMFDGD